MFCSGSLGALDRSILDWNKATLVPLVGIETYSDPCNGQSQTPWSINPMDFDVLGVSSTTAAPFADFSLNNAFSQVSGNGFEDYIYYCTDANTITETNPFGIVSACIFEYPDLTQPPYSFYGNLCTWVQFDTVETTYLVTPIILPP